MSVSKNDPRLTAYALGELGGEEAREFDALLRRDAAARAQVAAIREAGAWLERELTASSAPALSPRRRASIIAAAARPDSGPSVTAPSPIRERRGRWVLLAAVALPAVVAALTLGRQSLMGERAAPTAHAPGALDVVAERAMDQREPSAGSQDRPSASEALAPRPPAPRVEPQRMASPEPSGEQKPDEQRKPDGIAAPTRKRGAPPSEPSRNHPPRPEVSGVEATAGANDSDGETDDTGADDIGADDVGADDVGADDVGADDVGADDVGAEGGLVDSVVGGVVGGIRGGAAPRAGDTRPKRLTARVGQSLLAIDPSVSPYKVDLPEEYVQRGEEYHAPITICVAPNGTVSSVEILKPSIPIIDRQIPQVVPLWRYRPYLVDGRPTAFCYSTIYRVVRGR